MTFNYLVGATVAKALGPAISINNFLLRQARHAVLRMDAVQDLRVVVWAMWDDVTGDVLAGNFTDADLLLAYNLFVISRYLVIEQVGLAKWLSIITQKEINKAALIIIQSTPLSTAWCVIWVCGRGF